MPPSVVLTLEHFLIDFPIFVLPIPYHSNTFHTIDSVLLSSSQRDCQRRHFPFVERRAIRALSLMCEY